MMVSFGVGLQVMSCHLLSLSFIKKLMKVLKKKGWRESVRMETNRRTSWRLVCWFWPVLPFSVPLMSVGIRSTSPRGNGCQAASEQRRAEWGMKVGKWSNKGRTKSESITAGKKQLSAEIKTLSVIWAAADYSLKVWKDCRLSSFYPSDIQNPISGRVRGSSFVTVGHL